MYEELIQSLREKAEFLTISDVQKAPPGLSIKNLFAETMSEAADAIEAMCEMVADAYSENANLIASYEDRLRWIPVTERLPDEGRVVLAFGTRSCTTGQFRGTGSEPWFWWWKGNTIKRVTHWMPLPKFPEEDENDSY